MKKLFALSTFFFLFTFTLNAQMQTDSTGRILKLNPDGTTPSIHFTPFVYKISNMDVSNKFSFNVEVKAPVTYYLTVSGFYEKINYSVEPVFNVGTERYGITVSWYLNNIFK